VFPNVEAYRQRKDGTLVDVEIAAAPVRDSGGRVVSHMVVFTDITNASARSASCVRPEPASSRPAMQSDAALSAIFHDGAQQRLVSVSLLLRLASSQLDADPASARRELERSSEDRVLALAELRELARGLHSSIMTDRGLP
jgi:histidine kinase/PAS domain-containing protein